MKKQNYLPGAHVSEITDPEFKKLVEEFIEKFGVSPEFETKNLSAEGSPSFWSNSFNFEPQIFGEGRTEIESKISILMKIFELKTSHGVVKKIEENE